MFHWYKRQKKKRKKETKKRQNKLKTNGKLVDIDPAVCLITLNVNRTNTGIKKQRLSDQSFLKSSTGLYVLNKKYILNIKI